MATENLLIEIGTEELPPKSLRKLAESFAENFQQELVSNHLSFDEIKSYASPRRLAIKVLALATQQKDQTIEKRGPAVQVAFDENGQPTKAAEGWARSNGISVEQAERLKTDKGEWLLFKAVQNGRATESMLEQMLSNAINKLPIPKPMRWGSKSAQFIRPVHTLTILFGSKTIAANIFGIDSSNVIRGHRFHGSQQVILNNADDYETSLEKEFVIADFFKRKEKIKSLLTEKASALGASLVESGELLDEVTGIVEWPVVYVASFGTEFLRVPKEALIYTMKDDQKYFPLEDENGNLLSSFIFISNIESIQPAAVISGNEKVIRPRLSDAQFFFDTDRKQSLETHAEKLSSIVFQKQLGSLAEKADRVSQLASFIASKIGANEKQSSRAGLLSKADLVTNMVSEFPDVQGVMGMHYALHDGEDKEVAIALNEQYMPRFSGDSIPKSLVSCTLSLAEKFDTLTGIFGIGQVPKGDKDPFALRRAAIGIIRILIENEVHLDINQVISKSAELYSDKVAQSTSELVFDFILNRFRPFYQEQGIASSIIISIEKLRPSCPFEFDQRVKAVQSFLQLDQSHSLAAANKRVKNILAKQDAKVTADIDESLFESDHEKRLLAQLKSLEIKVEPMFKLGKFQESLIELASLRDNVDSFFDNVMVVADDLNIRNNRLALLLRLQSLFLNVADISELS